MSRPELLAPELARIAGVRPETVAIAAWRFSVSNWSLHPVDVRLDGDTLELVAGPLPARPAWALLMANAGMVPPARLVLNPRDEVLLHSEVVLDGSTQAARLIECAVCSLRDGLGAAGDAAGPAPPPAIAWDVGQAAAEAGLAGRHTGNGCFRVDPAAGGRAALLGPDLVARIEMLPAGDYPASVREAVATLLLRVTSGVRFVRAAGEENGAARLEVRFSAAPAAVELQAAVSALAVAGRCTEEIAVLTREEVAEMYLSVSGNPEMKGGDRKCQSRQQT